VSVLGLSPPRPKRIRRTAASRWCRWRSRLSAQRRSSGLFHLGVRRPAIRPGRVPFSPNWAYNAGRCAGEKGTLPGRAGL
jgi:hypothetical protein